MTKTYKAPPIRGYRDLTEEEVNLVNLIKEQGATLGEMLKMTFELEKVDPRWVRLGVDNIQTGLMQVVRGITRPDSF